MPVALLFIGFLGLCLYRLAVYPALWFDEGIVLQAAANVARDGQYGLRSMGGYDLFHPAIQTGPPVLLPIALALRLAGSGILQVRLVVVGYALVALAAFYALARHVTGHRAALLAALLLVFTFDHEFTSFAYMSRQVLAEVPALAFFWLGALWWFRSWSNPRPVALIGSGVLWGLAMLTKVQFALMLPAALGLFWLLDRFLGRRLSVRQVLVPLLVGGLCVAAWYGYQVWVMGFGDFWRQATELGSAGGIHFFNFVPRRAASAILQLSGSLLLLLGVPGMIYALGAAWQRREGTAEYQAIFLLLFTVLWLGWYALLSVGWMRYAFVPAAMSTLFAARLLADLWDWAAQGRRALGRRLPLTAGQLAVGSLIAVLLLSGLAPMARQIVQSQDSGLHALVAYLEANVPSDALIESWEWEVDFLTEHRFHHPPYEVTNAVTAQIWYGAPVSPELYDPLALRPAYLITGPFAGWTGLYGRQVLDRCTLLASIGEYDVYRVNDLPEGSKLSGR